MGIVDVLLIFQYQSCPGMAWLLTGFMCERPEGVRTPKAWSRQRPIQDQHGHLRIGEAAAGLEGGLLGGRHGVLASPICSANMCAISRGWARRFQVIMHASAEAPDVLA